MGRDPFPCSKVDRDQEGGRFWRSQRIRRWLPHDCPARHGLLASPPMSQRGVAVCPRTHSWATQSWVPAQPRGSQETTGSLWPLGGLPHPEIPQDLRQVGTTPRAFGPSHRARSSPWNPPGCLRNNKKTIPEGVDEEPAPSRPAGERWFPSFCRQPDAHVGESHCATSIYSWKQIFS